MPATILRFEPRDPAAPTPASPADGTEDAAAPAGLPPPLAVFRPRGAPTSQQIAHRWAMLSHLSRHFPRPPDTVR